VKVTQALRREPARRTRLAERVAETLVATPTFARQEEAIFHGDPHAGNVFYDKRRDELVILDWALTERLTREQRRQVLMMVLMTMLRDLDGICKAIEALRLHWARDDREQDRAVRAAVTRSLNALPLFHVPGVMDGLEILDEVAKEGIRFPAPLVMFRKAAFTLEGVIEDVAGTEVRMDSVLARYALRHWAATGATLLSLLTPSDWIALEWSAVTFAARSVGQAILRPLPAVRQAIAAELT
jgi:ubiquinone biosynthesis protein